MKLFDHTFKKHNQKANRQIDNIKYWFKFEYLIVLLFLYMNS